MKPTINTAGVKSVAATRAKQGIVRPVNTKASVAKRVSSSRSASFTAPSLTSDEGIKVAACLQQRLVSLLDLSLTLKHIHWNVVGPNFISVHMMLDPQHDGVETMVDDVAERIATLGGVPIGLPGRIVDARTWTDYALDRADALSHLGALDLVYTGVIEDHRAAIDAVGDIDAVSQDLLIGQTGVLERYQWFVRSHLADYAGGMANAGAVTEIDAATAVSVKSRRGVNPSKKSRTK
jgi:starvation-inducible DNA-binding protein